jgi:hypothetical protein
VDSSIPELQHYIYKADSVAQYLCPPLPIAFQNAADKCELYTWYMNAHSRVHSRTSYQDGIQAAIAPSPPSSRQKVVFESSSMGVLLCLVGSDYELYALFGPLIDHATATSCCTKLLKAIKKDEDKLFVLNVPKW